MVRQYKKLLCMILVFMLFMPMFNIEAVENNEFSDIVGHWSEQEIEKWIEAGLTNGYTDGTFRPNNFVTRAEFIALVNRAINTPYTGEFSFSDVSVDDWYYNYVNKAFATKYITEDGSGFFRPNESITRQEVALIISKLLNIEKPTENMFEKYDDYKKLDESIEAAMNICITQGIITGYSDNTIRLQSNITRAEAIIVLERLLGKQIRQSGTYDFENEEISSSLSIIVEDVTIENVTIKDNLYLGEGIGEGDITLNNVVVEGNTIVKGGGENTITIENSNLQKVFVFKANGKIRILSNNSTEARLLKLLSSGLISGGKIQDLEVATLEPGQTIQLEGDYENVNIKTQAVVTIDDTSDIGNLNIASSADGAEVKLIKGAKIDNLEINANSEVTGTAVVKKTRDNSDNSIVKISKPVTPQPVVKVTLDNIKNITVPIEEYSKTRNYEIKTNADSLSAEYDENLFNITFDKNEMNIEVIPDLVESVTSSVIVTGSKSGRKLSKEFEIIIGNMVLDNIETTSSYSDDNGLSVDFNFIDMYGNKVTYLEAVNSYGIDEEKSFLSFAVEDEYNTVANNYNGVMNDEYFLDVILDNTTQPAFISVERDLGPGQTSGTLDKLDNVLTYTENQIINQPVLDKDNSKIIFSPSNILEMFSSRMYTALEKSEGDDKYDELPTIINYPINYTNYDELSSNARKAIGDSIFISRNGIKIMRISDENQPYSYSHMVMVLKNDLSEEEGYMRGFMIDIPDEFNNQNKDFSDLLVGYYSIMDISGDLKSDAEIEDENAINDTITKLNKLPIIPYLVEYYVTRDIVEFLKLNPYDFNYSINKGLNGSQEATFQFSFENESGNKLKYISEHDITLTLSGSGITNSPNTIDGYNLYYENGTFDYDDFGNYSIKFVRQDPGSTIEISDMTIKGINVQQEPILIEIPPTTSVTAIDLKLQMPKGEDEGEGGEYFDNLTIDKDKGIAYYKVTALREGNDVYTYFDSDDVDIIVTELDGSSTDKAFVFNNEIKARKDGVVKVTAILKNGFGVVNGISDSAILTLTNQIDSFNISATALTIDTDNGTVDLTATFEPSYINNPVRWECEGAKIDENGVLTAWKNGTYTVRATVEGSSIQSNELTLTFTNQVTELKTKEDILTIHDDVDGGLHYRLENDIDFQGSGGNWQPINLVDSIFDGQEFTISNCNSAYGTLSDNAFFLSIENSEVKNLNIVNANNHSYTSQGTNLSILAATTSGSTIQNVHVEGALSDENNYFLSNRMGVGGLIGWALNTDVIDSSANIQITVEGFCHVGGLVGYFESGTIENSHTEGTINEGFIGCVTGSIAGYIGNAATVKTCSSTLNIISTSD